MDKRFIINHNPVCRNQRLDISPQFQHVQKISVQSCANQKLSLTSIQYVNINGNNFLEQVNVRYNFPPKRISQKILTLVTAQNQPKASKKFDYSQKVKRFMSRDVLVILTLLKLLNEQLFFITEFNVITKSYCTRHFPPCATRYDRKSN